MAAQKKSLRGKRNKRGPQLPEILPSALEAARCVAQMSGWATVSKEIKLREKRHPKFKAGTSPKRLRDIMRNDGEKLQYGQLEALAGVFGIPSGVLLDVSHVMSYLRTGTAEDAARAVRYADGLQELARMIKEKSKKRAALGKAAQRDEIRDLYEVWRSEGLDVQMPHKKRSGHS